MKIYVGHLTPDVTDEDLRTAFAAHGEVESAEVVKDRYSGDSRGFGFVVMPEKQEAVAAITALQDQEFMGSSIEVNEARPPVDRGRGQGGQGGQGGKRRDDRRGGGGRRRY